MHWVLCNCISVFIKKHSDMKIKIWYKSESWKWNYSVPLPFGGNYYSEWTSSPKLTMLTNSRWNCAQSKAAGKEFSPPLFTFIHKMKDTRICHVLLYQKMWFSISFLFFFLVFLSFIIRRIWCGGQNTLLINKRPTPSPPGDTLGRNIKI